MVAGISTLSMIAEYVDDEATVMQMVGGIKLQLVATNASRRPLDVLHLQPLQLGKEGRKASAKLRTPLRRHFKGSS